MIDIYRYFYGNSDKSDKKLYSSFYIPCGNLYMGVRVRGSDRLILGWQRAPDIIGDKK